MLLLAEKTRRDLLHLFNDLMFKALPGSLVVVKKKTHLERRKKTRRKPFELLAVIYHKLGRFRTRTYTFCCILWNLTLSDILTFVKGIPFIIQINKFYGIEFKVFKSSIRHFKLIIKINHGCKSNQLITIN